MTRMIDKKAERARNTAPRTKRQQIDFQYKRVDAAQEEVRGRIGQLIAMVVTSGAGFTSKDIFQFANLVTFEFDSPYAVADLLESLDAAKKFNPAMSVYLLKAVSIVSDYQTLIDDVEKTLEDIRRRSR